MSGETAKTEAALAELEVAFDGDDVAVVQFLCHLVSERSAVLVSICLASLLERMDRPETTVAVDGSLFKLHPRLKTLMQHYVAQMAPGKKVQAKFQHKWCRERLWWGSTGSP